jgi:glycine/D-amino acid oxidase-like deaminating enzyme
MRNYDRSKLDVTARRYFGGGSSGPSKAQIRAQQSQHNDMMAMMNAQSAAAAQMAQQQAAQARAQQEQMREQLSLMAQQREDALASQREQLELMKSQQVKPDPMAKVVDPEDPTTAMQKQAAKRKGLRQSILAGESENPVTGPYVLG